MGTTERWERELVQDGEYTGPGDDPPGYAGDWEPSNTVGYWDGEGEEAVWVFVAYCANGMFADRIVRLPELEREAARLRANLPVHRPPLTTHRSTPDASEEKRGVTHRLFVSVPGDCIAEWCPGDTWDQARRTASFASTVDALARVDFRVNSGWGLQPDRDAGVVLVNVYGQRLTAADTLERLIGDWWKQVDAIIDLPEMPFNVSTSEGGEAD